MFVWKNKSQYKWRKEITNQSLSVDSLKLIDGRKEFSIYKGEMPTKRGTRLGREKVLLEMHLEWVAMAVGEK